MRTRKRWSLPKHQVIILLVFIIAIMTFPVIMHLSRMIRQNMINFASAEVRKVTLVVITNSVNMTIDEHPDFNDMFSIVTNDEGIIELLDFDTIEVNRFLNRVSQLVQLNFQALENGALGTLGDNNALGDFNIDALKDGIVYQMPVAYIFGTPLLSNIGPRIPVRVVLAGSVYSFLETEIEEYGINNAMVRIILKVRVLERINMPLVSTDIEVVRPTVVAVKMIQGQVPDFYQSGGADSRISIPFQSSQ